MNNQTSITLTYEDLLSLRSVAVGRAVDKFFHEGMPFSTAYMDTVLVEPCGNNTIALCNYQMQPKTVINRHSLGRGESDILRQTSTVILHPTGWSALKRLFDCMESYYNICAECSPIVRSLVARYCQYLSRHYRTRAMLTANTSGNGAGCNNASPISSGVNHLDSDLVRHIHSDLPTHLQELDERRLPSSDSMLDSSLDYNAVRYSMTTWIDSEVRRYCGPNIVDSVIENLIHFVRR